MINVLQIDRDRHSFSLKISGFLPVITVMENNGEKNVKPAAKGRETVRYFQDFTIFFICNRIK